MENVIKIDFYGTDKIICSAKDWTNMDREEKVQQECKERKEKPPKFSKIQKKLINLITLTEE